jgi:hypothetical protein
MINNPPNFHFVFFAAMVTVKAELTEAAKAAKAAAEEKEETEITCWLSTVSMSDVLIDNTTKKLLSIKCVLPKDLLVKTLRRFCVANQISGYKNKTKEMTCDLIASQKSSDTLVDGMYPEDALARNAAETLQANDADDFSEPEDTEKDEFEKDEFGTSGAAVSTTAAVVPVSVQDKTQTKKKGKHAKSTAPASVTMANTYFRIINVYMDERHRPDVLKLGGTATKEELDARKFSHKSIYDKLLLTYLDETIIHVGELAFSEQTYFKDLSLPENYPATFDTITSLEFKQGMNYIHHHFRVSYRNCKTSGNHSVFGKFVGNRAYLFYYFLWLQEVPHFMTFAVPALPAEALRQSRTIATPVDPPASPSMGPGTTPASAKLMDKRKNRKTEFSNAVANLESSSTEKIAVMKEFAQKKHDQSMDLHPIAVARDKSILFDEFSEKVKTARANRDEIRATPGYASDSSEALDAKENVAYYKRKRDETKW